MDVAVVVPGNGAFDRDGAWRITSRCRRLVAEAEQLARALAADTVVFTGWSPLGHPSEAEQMKLAWRGPHVELVLEPTARTTAENASRTLPLLLERGVERAAVVCAPAHLLRARLFFGLLYRNHGVATQFRVVSETPTVSAVVRELAALAVLPWQVAAARAELQRTVT